MKRQRLKFLRAFLRVAASILVTVVIGTAVAHGQVAKRDGTHEVQAPGTPWSRTAWGDPDLQGIWVGSTLTPLERPARYEGREVLTEEETAQWRTKPLSGMSVC